MTKKIFIISIILLGIALLFLGVYNFVFKKDSVGNNSNISPNEELKNNSSARKEKSAIVKISEDQVLRAVLARDSEKIKYYATDGTVWEIGVDGNGKKQISSDKLSGLQNALWSPDGTKVITSFSKEGASEFFTYDYQTKKAFKLKSNLDSVIWDNIGAKIIYKYYDQKSGERTLNVANPDGGDWKKLADLSFKNLSASPVPQTSLISFWNTPSASEESLLQSVGTSGGDVQKIFSGRFGADYLWSPDGSSALVSSLSEKNGKFFTLGVIDRSGTYRDLNVPTMASKCVWSADKRTVYYALPGSIPENSVIPDEYMAKKFFTTDTFWKIDISTGKKERLAELADIDGQYDATKLFLSSGESALIFMNRVDGKLYKIEL